MLPTVETVERRRATALVSACWREQLARRLSLACTPSPWLAQTYTTACPCLHIFGPFPTHS